MKVKYIIKHTDLTTEMWTDFESFLKTDSVQQVKHVNHTWYLSVFCFFLWIQEKI